MKQLLALFICSLPFVLSAQKEEEANRLLLLGWGNSSITATEELVVKKIEAPGKKDNILNALRLWKDLVASKPNNANFNFKTGLCYYYTFDQQLNALPYFRKAVKDLTPKYDFKSLAEDKAPYSALYFLGRLYLEAGQPDSALACFGKYQDFYELSPINAQRDILMALNLKKSLHAVRNVKVTNLGKAVNSEYAETNPVANAANNLLFFASRRPLKPEDANEDMGILQEDIYFSTKNASGNWETPKPFRFNTPYDEAPLFLTADGTTLYFRQTTDGNSDIYTSSLVSGAWSQPELVIGVNSPATENGVSVTADGKMIYFSSNRNKEGGKYDIYRCEKEVSGRWGNPELLSHTINTAFNEVSPAISPDGKTLYFCSDGFAGKGLGGFDVYVSELKSDSIWSEPVNLGSPINSSRNEIDYYVSTNNIRYFSRLTADNSYDLFEVEGGSAADLDALIAGTDATTVTSEVGVTQVVETEKKVDHDVDVTTTVETEVEKEKEVEVTKVVEQVVEKPVVVAEGSGAPAATAEQLKQLKAQKPADKPAMPTIVANTDKIKPNETNAAAKVVYFDFNQITLNATALKDLDALADYLTKNTQSIIEIAGHADNKGAWNKNISVSNKRSQEVYNYLLSKHISAERMVFFGKGAAEPLADNSTDDNRSKNRRVEVFILNSVK